MKSRWWVPLRRKSQPGQLKLLFFPFAGGAISAFARAAAELPAWIEPIGVQLPGRAGRLDEPAIKQMSELVEALDNAIGSELTEPFAFFGYSMGALLAYEYARLLRSRQRAMPQCLVVAAAGAPDMPRTASRIHDLPPDKLTEALRRYGRTPKAVLDDADLMDLFAPTIRADFEVVETYKYAAQPPLEVPIVSVGGRSDSIVPLENLRGWSKHTQGPWSCHVLPGGHFFLETCTAAVMRFTVDGINPAFSETTISKGISL